MGGKNVEGWVVVCGKVGGVFFLRRGLLNDILGIERVGLMDI